MMTTRALAIVMSFAFVCHFAAASPIDRTARHMRGSIELANVDASSAAANKNGTALIPTSYGNQDCRCVGIDYIVGSTQATMSDGSKVSYPADLGARCQAWDMAKHPKCHDQAVPEDWCYQKWCYVDPCKCKLSVLPKPSVYIAGAKFQGKAVHYSYATCDAKDSYTAEDAKTTATAIEGVCAAQVAAADWGSEGCRCIGIGPQQGATKVSIKGKLVDFPADTGATCNKWEQNNHPDCTGSNPPDFCKESWCYVDPCTCKSATPPKPSYYLPTANFQGKPIFYSYATCGGADYYGNGVKKAEQTVESICK
jgi:hypothetical protein